MTEFYICQGCCNYSKTRPRACGECYRHGTFVHVDNAVVGSVLRAASFASLLGPKGDAAELIKHALKKLERAGIARTMV